MLEEDWLGSAQAAAVASMDRAVHRRVAAKPGFHQLKRPMVTTWRVDDGDSAMLARSLQDIGRFLIGIWSLHLHRTPGGLTRGRLAEVLKDSGLSGPGRAPSLLLFLRFIRYIEPAPSVDDRRVQRYLPTARMIQAFRDRLRRDLTAFWPADPALLRIAPHLDQDLVVGAYWAGVGEVTRHAFVDHRPDHRTLEAFSQRYGGMAVLAELLLSGPEDGPFPPQQVLSANLSDLARRCHISRAQVRGVLAAGQKADFLELLPGNRCRLTPQVDDHLEMLLAGSLITASYAARRTVEQLDRAADLRSA